MSGIRRSLADLLKNDCFADDKHFEMLFAGARNGSAAGKNDHDQAAGVLRHSEAGRDFADTGLIHRPSSLCGRLGWGAQMMFRRPVNVCNVKGRVFLGLLWRDAAPAALYASWLAPSLTDRQPARQRRRTAGMPDCVSLRGTSRRGAAAFCNFTKQREEVLPRVARLVCDGAGQGRVQA
jgi:hypothetical protein